MSRSKGRKHTFKIFLVLLFLMAAGGCVAYTLRIDDGEIEIRGNKKYTKEEMTAYIFKSDLDRNPFVLYYKTKFGKQEKIPFVDEYDVEFTSLQKIKITVYEKKIIGYVQYKGVNMYFDKDGTIVESSTEEIENIPRITGLKFDYIVLDETLPVGDEKIFHLILDVTQALAKYEVGVDRIFISEKQEVTLYMEQVVVELGKYQDIAEKIQSLADMLPNLSGLSGTLNMKEYDEKGNGYTFKKR
ncbi:MAG: cell division protein FtsQ [Lachnospiraceae bacterium]|nr:cell division protein FtsQ [Lachnospiraceae bacterium]